MEKKEKKSDLEGLLNSLIEKGWKPFGDNNVIRVKYGYSVHFLCRPIVNFVLDGYAEATVPLKEILTSRSSGLWKFVCENGMVKTCREFISWTKNANCDDYGNLFWDKSCPKDFYEYRLIESALCDEDKLEEFLLNSIKLD